MSKKLRTRNPLAGASWTMLLSMAGIPLTAMLMKLFPELLRFWQVLVIAGVLVFVNGLVRFVLVRPTSRAAVDVTNEVSINAADIARAGRPG